MAKGLYQSISQTWKEKKGDLDGIVKNRLITWRKMDTVERIEEPTRLDRARALGYKAKTGYTMARVRVSKGGRRREAYGRRGRKNSKAGLVTFTSGKSDRWIAEEKAQKRFSNLEILNSYQVGEDGRHKWFEIIMVDPKTGGFSGTNSRRAFRGLTSSGKKARGI